MSDQNEALENSELTPANADKKDELVLDELPQLTAAELQDELEALRKTNSRLLDESKGNKTKYQTGQKQLEEFEKDRLKEKEDFKSLSEKLQEKLDAQNVRVAKARIKEAVAAHADGCSDIEALLLLGNHKMLSYDEDAESVGGVEDFVRAVKESRPYLFAAVDKEVIHNRPPTAGKKMDKGAALRACTTQAQLDAYHAGVEAAKQ